MADRPDIPPTADEMRERMGTAEDALLVRIAHGDLFIELSGQAHQELEIRGWSSAEIAARRRNAARITGEWPAVEARQGKPQRLPREDLAAKLKRTFNTPLEAYGEHAQDELFGIPTGTLLNCLTSGVADFQPGWRSIVRHELRRRGVDPDQRKGLNRAEPPPIPNDRPAIQELVVDDLAQRMAHGIEKYGTPLQAFNGRQAIVDLYQELLDAACYARQIIEEQGLGHMLEDS